MKWSLNLGKILGVKILVHWTFLLLIFWIVFIETSKGSDLNQTVLTVGYVLSIFFCVVLHELGHSLMARKYGIGTRKITLLPIGGVASLEKIPEEPIKEFNIAIAGPMVNVVICLLLLIVIGNPVNAFSENLEEMATVSRENFFFSLFLVNLFLVAFNAIPAFPMDGGRVLRAALAMRIGRLKATNIAAKLGQVFALLFFFFGLLYNPILIFIGLFVFFGAYSENAIVQQLEFIKGHTVREAMMTEYQVLNPENTIDEAKDKLISSPGGAFAVVEDGGILGIVNRNDIVTALQNGNVKSPVSDIMNKNIEFCTPNEKLTSVFYKLQKKGNTIFPVVEGNRLMGLIDSNNIANFIKIQSALNY